MNSNNSFSKKAQVQGAAAKVAISAAEAYAAKKLAEPKKQTITVKGMQDKIQEKSAIIYSVLALFAIIWHFSYPYYTNQSYIEPWLPQLIQVDVFFAVVLTILAIASSFDNWEKKAAHILAPTVIFAIKIYLFPLLWIYLTAPSASKFLSFTSVSFTFFLAGVWWPFWLLYLGYLKKDIVSEWGVKIWAIAIFIVVFISIAKSAVYHISLPTSVINEKLEQAQQTKIDSKERSAQLADLFLCSINPVSSTGELITVEQCTDKKYLARHPELAKQIKGNIDPTLTNYIDISLKPSSTQIEYEFAVDQQEGMFVSADLSVSSPRVISLSFTCSFQLKDKTIDGKIVPETLIDIKQEFREIVCRPNGKLNVGIWTANITARINNLESTSSLERLFMDKEKFDEALKAEGATITSSNFNSVISNLDDVGQFIRSRSKPVSVGAKDLVSPIVSVEGTERSVLEVSKDKSYLLQTSILNNGKGIVKKVKSLKVEIPAKLKSSSDFCVFNLVGNQLTAEAVSKLTFETRSLEGTGYSLGQCLLIPEEGFVLTAKDIKEHKEAFVLLPESKLFKTTLTYDYELTQNVKITITD